MPPSTGAKHNRTPSSAGEQSAAKRLQTQSSTPLALAEATKKISTLQTQLENVLDFVEKAGIARDAPPAVKAILLSRDSGLAALASSIGQRMGSEHYELVEQTLNSRKTGVSSDDLSSAVEPFIDEIDDLSKLDNPKALEKAYDLLNSLREMSYGDMDGGCGYGDRPSDEPADELLARIVRERADAGEIWDWRRDLKEIQSEGEFLAEYGVGEPWFPETQEALEDLCDGEKQQVTEGSEA